MTTLYAVSSGKDSEYRIDAIFDDKSLAEQWMSIYGGSDIEEYTLNVGVDEMRHGLYLYMVWIHRNGDCRSIQKVNPEGRSDDPKLYFARGVLRVLTYARDDQHAIDIANEKRIYVLSHFLWKDEGFGSVEPTAL